MKRSYQFCLFLLRLGRTSQKPLVNIILGLCSTPGIRHVVEVSLSPFFQYSYSIVTKVVTRWKCERETLLIFVLNWLGPARKLSNGKTFFSFIHDFTKISKPHSECLATRSFHVTNNPIGGRRQLSGGYDLGCLVYDSAESGHCPVVDYWRLDGDENQLEIARSQTASLMKHLNVSSDYIFIKTDSNYGRAAFLHMAYAYHNMLIISRLQSGINVYTPYEGEEKRGRKRIFGDTYVLCDQSRDKAWYEPKTGRRGIKRQISIHELTHSEQVEYETELGKSKQKVLVQVTRWNHVLLRSKRGLNMEDKPIDILSIKIIDKQTKIELFKRPMFLCIAGAQSSEIPTADIAQEYKGRYQIEPQFRFTKYDLLMDKFETPDVNHLDVWLKIIQLCSWFLYLTAQEVRTSIYQKWQRHLEKNKKVDEVLSPAEARRAAENNIRDYDLKPFAPKPFKIGTGRKAGTKMPARAKVRIRKKAEIKAEKLARAG
jgi:hypothetical protein